MENKTTSLRSIARTGGVLYLIIIAAGIFGELFVRDKLIVSGDAAATASHIMASPLLWRMGIAGDLLMHVCDVGLMVVFYVLLKPVNRNLALLAVLFTLVQTAALVAGKLNLIVALFPLENAAYLRSLEPAQLQALMYLSIKADAYSFAVGLIFFGFACLVIGYLIFMSGFFPELLGILMLIAGLCYLTNSFVMILAPQWTHRLVPAILLPPFIGELSLCLWLLFKGPKDPRRIPAG